MNSTTLLKEVARGIRYHSLPHLIGRKIKIINLETVEADVQKNLGKLLPNECMLNPDTVKPLGIAKYGILDLEFLVPNTTLESDYQLGIALLRELGFDVKREQTKGTGDSLTDDPFCLPELAEDIAKKQTLLKLFLESDSIVPKYVSARMSYEAIRELLDNLTLPAEYFPQEFVITDACLTNAGFIWFHKHFYL